MRKKLKYILFMILIFTIALTIKSFARITTNDPTVNSGEKVTITINSQEPVSSGGIDISSNDGLIFESASGGEANGTFLGFSSSNNKTSGIATYTFTAPEISENKTYKVVFISKDMVMLDENGYEKPVADSSATATVTVKAKEQTSSSTNTPTTPEKPTVVTEPKFTDVNKTMYATGDINLRSSWSTSSSATQIKKGTELKITGTSTDKVNGYVWYRVNYNGETKYVASTLLTSTKPEEKSNNSNLKILKIDNQTLNPTFNKDVTKYTMEVGKDVTELNIKLETEDEKATTSIKGNKNLKEGKNTVTITVNAEDGTNKVYEIEVTKLDTMVEKPKLGLESLVIKGIDLNPDFETDVYEYEINVKNKSKLEIEAFANNEEASIEILGNEELEDGENLITIIVSLTEEKEAITYQIKVNKVVETNASVVTDNSKNEDSKIMVYIVVVAILLIALVIGIIYTIKRRKQNEFDYSGYGYNYNIDDDNNNEDEYFDNFPGELPERQDNKKEKNLELENEINVINNQIMTDKVEDEKAQERKAKLDYFLDLDGSQYKEDNTKGKHF